MDIVLGILAIVGAALLEVGLGYLLVRWLSGKQGEPLDIKHLTDDGVWHEDTH